ncbi:Taurine-binding periplasmic protein [Commensalibacter sp. Nvir]|uniref:taurine ABC transporter substrate-binding protein n=1 Tax=Commensalibacter sp. Nvir TaxID=3069817 RepID=UPI002D73AFD8|nr:Taurine-binding periplasmic protein [Commensalibacter sp. Nvir]
MLVKSFLENYFRILCIVILFLFFSYLVILPANAEIRIAWQQNIDVAKLAQTNDVFRKITGDRINWLEYDDEFKMIHDLSIEKIDFAPVNMITLMSAVTAGVQVRIIAVDYQDGSESGLLVQKRNHIDQISFLKGKKIGVPFLSNAHYSLLEVLKNYNINLDQVQLINMTPREIEEAWKKNQLDAAFVEGMSFINLKKTGVILVTSKELADKGNPTYVFWISMDNTVADKPQMVQSFVDAILKNQQRFKLHQSDFVANSKVIKATASFLKASPTDILTILNGQEYLSQKSQYLLINRILPSYLDKVGLFLRNYNVINNVLPDYLIYIYPTFINEAQKN